MFNLKRAELSSRLEELTRYAEQRLSKVIILFGVILFLFLWYEEVQLIKHIDAYTCSLLQSSLTYINYTYLIRGMRNSDSPPG